MMERIRILFLSANPWTTSRILVDEEAREIFEKLQQGPYRDSFELHKHAAIRPIDLQRLLMMYKPHIVHFSGHGSKTQKIILSGTPGRGKEVDRQGLAGMFALYKDHVRLIFLNACFTKTQARALSEFIDYSVGTGKGIGDKGGVVFAGAFYRALGFGKSVKEAFESAQAEIALTKMPRTRGFELFVRSGISENDSFPQSVGNLSSEAANPWELLSYLLDRDYDILNCGSALLREDPVRERTERPEVEIQPFETSNMRPPGRAIRQEEDIHICEHSEGHVSLIRRETGVRALALERSSPALSSLRGAKRAKRAGPRTSEDEIGRRSSTSYSCVDVTLRANVRRVLSISAPSVSQTDREDQDLPGLRESCEKKRSRCARRTGVN